MENWSQKEIYAEIERIKRFIREFVYEEESVVVPVSGGIDSDVVARLCCKSVGKARVKLFIVIQSEMEEKFLEHASMLSRELDVPLAEIHLEQMNADLMRALEQGDRGGLFRTDILLDQGKAKCSLRSAVISSYQDKGFLIAGTMNKTEKQLGFFLTFGDNLANFKPVAHLYKTQLRELARCLGTAEEVINQEPSAGWWEGQTDLEDLAYWVVNDGPIVIPRDFTEEEIRRVEQIKNELTLDKIDKVLMLKDQGMTAEEIVACVELSKDIISGLLHIVEKSKRLKNREIMVEIGEKDCCITD